MTKKIGNTSIVLSLTSVSVYFLFYHSYLEKLFQKGLVWQKVLGLGTVLICLGFYYPSNRSQNMPGKEPPYLTSWKKQIVKGEVPKGKKHDVERRKGELQIMIARIWQGWTTAENADRYEILLKEEVFPGIAAKKVPGYREIQLFRRSMENDEVAFITIMWFDCWNSVKAFAGEEYERAYVPRKAREVLARFDERSQHYEVKERLKY